jgi:hypothetical protein
MAIDSDPNRSASHLNLFAHLSGPFRGGAVDTPIPITATPRLGPDGPAGADFVASVAATARRPLLLVGTRARVGARGFRATVSITPQVSSPTTTTAELHFAPFTEAGAFLPVWQSDDEVAPALDCTIAVTGAPTTQTPIDLLDLHLVEGVMGRLLYLLGVEKARLRRQGRELFALRRMDFAIDPDTSRDHRRLGHAFDRMGADLGVPRFADRVTWDAAKAQVLSVSEREPNETYRRRLEMMRRFMMPSRSNVLDALRSFGGAPYEVNEANSELAVAIALVSSPDDSPRKRFLAYLRTNYLVEPGQRIPASRPLPSKVRAAQQPVLDRIGGIGGDVSQASFDVPAGTFIAPLLAEALDRVGRARRALGVTRRWKILRGQDDAGGSRYELGLGVDVEAIPAIELDELAAKLAAKAFAPGTDPETLALLMSVTAKSSTDDPTGRWLLSAAGLRTIHPIAGDRWYLSHFPIFGMLLTATGGSPLGLEARFHAPGDPGPHAALAFALADIVRDAAAATLPAFTQLPAAAAATAIAAAVLPDPATLTAFTAAGLRTPDTAGNLALVEAELAAVQATDLIANQPHAVAQLARLVEIMGAREVISALPLVTGGGVLLVISTSSLPAAARLNSPRYGFRWHLMPITGLSGGLDHATGARNQYTAPNAGENLAAVIVVSMARRDRADPRDCIPPYQVRVELPATSLLDLAGYERMMNLLERAVPISVVMDTSLVREHNVDPAGSGTTVPFTGRMAHTFRTYKQRRHLGNVNNDSE